MGAVLLDNLGSVGNTEAAMCDDERILQLIRALSPVTADKLTPRVMGEGLEKYGSVDLATDPRDWAQEATEELLDACYYLGALYIKLQRQGASTVLTSGLILRLDMCLWLLEGFTEPEGEAA